ncbi:MAG: pilus assembly protein [Actinobacteria bacterium]|nr:pilus assembly protein [Actinomycetota bacterium]
MRDREIRFREDGERGSAIVEFVFVAVLVMVPLVYLIVAVAVVQRARLATTNAARDVGRAIATSETAGQAEVRAEAALRAALHGQGLTPADVEVRYVEAGSDCDAAATVPSLAPASVFAVCVTRHQSLPAVPSVLAGRGITVVGRYLVHVDDFRIIAR